jgi:hypothetical protein
MVDENLHPAEHDLLFLADGELPARRANLVRHHVAACWDCRTRMAEIEGTIGELMRVHRETLDRQLTPVSGPRAQLKVRLAEISQSAQRDSWRGLRFGLNTRAVSLVVAMALMASLGGVLWCWQAMKSEPDVTSDAAPLPDPHLTPGATTAVTISDICSMNHDVVVRQVASVLQQGVFREYGMRNSPATNYEIDFLISPGLGGAEELRNLWPEPRFHTVWNSFVKDQLEDYLHQSVCSGRITLAAAQQDIAGNWISAYKKYFHLEKPLMNNPTSDASRASSPLAFFPIVRAQDFSLVFAGPPIYQRRRLG